MPFISGDLFADKSDISVFNPRMRGSRFSLKELKEAKVIFCPSHRIQELFDEYGSAINAPVVIGGNSDYEFHDMPNNIPKSVRQLFLQNSFISDNSLVTTLPIGIENFRWGVNGNPKYLTSEKDWSDRANRILMGPFGLTHSDRYVIRDRFREPTSSIEFVRNRMSPRDFNSLSQSFRYVACVRGNGVDTHRLWESLYRGSIPILKLDLWSISLKELEVPIVYVKDWSVEVLEGVLKSRKVYEVNPNKIHSIWWPYWKNQIGIYV